MILDGFFDSYLATHPSPAPLLVAQAADAAKAMNEMSVLDYIRSGHVVGYMLIALSFVAVGLMIWHLLEVRRVKLMPPGIAEELLARVRAGNIDGAKQICSSPENRSFITNMVGAALQRCTLSPFGFIEIRGALEDSGSREIDRLYRTTDGIGLIAAIGPMLGLLGTVFGMIGAFGAIGQLEGASRSLQLASFMSIALVTTAEGLIVAVPCTIAYSLFRRRIERLVGEVSEVTEQLATYLERFGEQAQAAPIPRPVPRAAAVPAPLPAIERNARAS